jgi:hypothetical protein
MKLLPKKIFILVLLCLLAGCGFATIGYSPYDPPGFFMGIWHGLLAPWSLIARFFFDVKTHAFPNSGWFYDLGFLIGVGFSIPVGWIAALIAAVVHILA